MKKLLIAIGLLFFLTGIVSAANPGTIDTVNKYAKILSGPYAGTQINFRPNDTASSQPILIYNDHVRGHAWGEATGWIVFSCEDTVDACSTVNFKVYNNGSGELVGYAWGQLTGWISFSCKNSTASCNTAAGNWGVSINSNGEFTGYAWSQNFGWIQFNCSVSGACLETDWAQSSGGAGSSGGGTSGGSGTTGTTGTGTTTTGTGSTTGSTTTGTGTTTTGTTGGTGSSGGTSSGTSTTGTTGSGITGTTGTGTTTTGTGSTTGSTTTGSGTSTGSGSGTGTGGTGSASGGSLTGFGTGFAGIGGGPSFDIVTTGFSSFIKNLATPEFFEEVGEKTAEAIPVAGVVAGLVATLVSIFFTQALSFSEILFLPLRMWSSVLLIFGVTKKPWGTVYDSLTKQPIDPAYVSLIDVVTGEEVASSLTDINGRYGFADVKKGRYKIVASKTHYKFPSTYLMAYHADDIYDDIYHGEEFDILEDGALITKNIPLDAESVDWNEVAKRQQNLMSFNPVKESRWQKIAHFIFIVGFLGSILLMLAQPSQGNKLSLLFYIVCGIIMYVLRIPKVRASLSRSHAIVLESEDENPVPFAKVEILNPMTGTVVAKRVTNHDGMFYALVEKGTYSVHISKPQGVGEYAKVFESAPTNVKKGFISSRFEI